MGEGIKICPRCKIREKAFFSNGIQATNYCKVCRKEVYRGWYSQNRKIKIQKTLERLKETNYAAEKKPRQRKIRSIKRATRREFPLIGKSCEICNSRATEHHHNTYPIKKDKFLFLCHDCHVKVQRIESNCSTKQLQLKGVIENLN